MGATPLVNWDLYTLVEHLLQFLKGGECIGYLDSYLDVEYSRSIRSTPIPKAPWYVPNDLCPFSLA